MEYDNDRRIKPTSKMEVFYWVLLGLFSPLVNSVTLFFFNWQMWILLFSVNILLLPAYVLYARWIVPRFLFQNRRITFVLLSVALFIFIHSFLFSIYSFLLNSAFRPEAFYFSYSLTTIIRESMWAILNMFLAFNIAIINKAVDEKDLLADLQKDNTDFKVKYLRSQLNPHFLFNTLNSIYSLSLQKSDQTPEVVVKLADIMRYLIDDCNKPKIPLTKEIEFIQNFLEIEKIRHKADISFTVEGETKDIMIEPFLFISFIENGFKHAFNNAYTDSFIYITLKSEPGQITLTVVNNTNTDIETQAKKIYGTGIKNSKDLLELLYPGFYALDIIQTEKMERRKSLTRLKNATDRLKALYADSHTLDVILNNNAFTVSLILKSG